MFIKIANDYINTVYYCLNIRYNYFLIHIRSGEEIMNKNLSPKRTHPHYKPIKLFLLITKFKIK